MSKEYTLTVGLEVHAELNTHTKMFCNSLNNPDETKPNVNVCPICMGHPGTLPVINKEAVRSVLKLGTALGGKLADYSEFDRKNYFYPDIPKGYQISQYKHPLVSGGELAGVPITRVHLEEDTARSLHGSASNSQFTISNSQSNPNEPISNDNSNNENSLKIIKLKTENSLIDFNRAGVPLMELVTEPAMHSAEEVGRFARELQLLLLYLGISEANMEKGEMRVEANISVAPLEKSEIRNPKSETGSGLKDSNLDIVSDFDIRYSKLGVKVEVKNLNSFKAMEKAIAYEYERQVKLLEEGGKVAQETRGWDENKQETFAQRSKEESHDYRYFPEPDLPKLFLSEVPEFAEAKLKESLPELPWEKRERLLGLGLSEEHAEIFTSDLKWGHFFDEVVQIITDDTELLKLASNYITSDLKAPIPALALVQVVKMAHTGEISSRGAKDILKLIEEDPTKDPEQVAKKRGLIQESDPEVMKTLAQQVIDTNSEAVAEYKAGKESSLQYLVGQGMKESKGSANPQVLQEVLKELLG